MDLMRLGLLGINFKTADLVLRESVVRAVSLTLFFRHPHVVLSTCNRTEIYFSAEDLAEAHTDLLAFLRLRIEGEFEQRLYSYFGHDALIHLCRVASGLDSAVFAETEIQRQVKQAYGKAALSQRLTPALHYAFQKALKTGKLVRQQRVEKAPTLFGMLWKMAEWTGKKILLVGASEMNRGFASFLLYKGLSGFSLCTRRPEMLHLEGVHVVGRDLLSLWTQFDLIVAASQSEGYLIAGEGTGQTIFDLSIPRLVDPATEGVTLYNLEQIHKQMGTVNADAERLEALVWEQGMRLAHLYHAKQVRTLSGLGSAGRG